MLPAQVAPIYWCCNVRSTNILVLLVLAAPIGKDTQTFYNLNNFADFFNVCSANILVLTDLQHQYIGAVQGELNCLQHHAYLVKRCCAAKAFYSYPAIISRRPESQKTPKEPQLNPEDESRIIQARSHVTLEKSSRNYKPSEE